LIDFLSIGTALEPITLNVWRLIIDSYNQTTINYINKRKKAGTQVILATASHEFYARKVAKHMNWHCIRTNHAECMEVDY
jgi:phosphoserine phosphatase